VIAENAVNGANWSNVNTRQGTFYLTVSQVMPPEPAVYPGGDAGLHTIAINNTISQVAHCETCILSVLENSGPVHKITAYQ